MKLHAHDLGGEEVERLPQHDRLGLDASHAPAEHSEPVNHRGVGVGAHQRVGEEQDVISLLAGQHHLGQKFQVDLMHDTGGWWNNPEVVEGLLTPAQKFIPFTVPLELDLGVPLQGGRRPKEVHLY